MKKIISILFILQTIYFFGQTTPIWTACVGNIYEDKLFDVKNTSDGGSIVVGYYNTPGNGERCLISKIDDNGNIEWEKKYGGIYFQDYAYSVIQTLDGGYVFSGVNKSNSGDITGNHGSWDCWVVKVNSLGNLIWQKSLGGSDSEEAKSIGQTTDGGYIITGYTNSNDFDVSGNHGNRDYWVVKLNNIGNIEWQKTLGGSGDDTAYSIQQTLDGGYIVSGNSNSNDGDITNSIGQTDFWLVKLNNIGTIEWQKTFGGSTYFDFEPYTIQTNDGGYITVGSSYSYMDSGTQGNVFKVNSSGILEWQRLIGDYLNISYFKSIIETLDGGYAIIGTSNSGDIGSPGFSNHGGSDLWFLKLNALGTTEGQRSFGSSAYDTGTSIQKALNGDYIIVGYVGSGGQVLCNHSTSNYDGWVAKLSANLLGIYEEENKNSIYPNPSTSEVTVNIDKNNFNLLYNIYDNTGRNVLNGKLNYENPTINILDLSKGIYILKINGPNSLNENFKILKQ